MRSSVQQDGGWGGGNVLCKEDLRATYGFVRVTAFAQTWPKWIHLENLIHHLLSESSQPSSPATIYLCWFNAFQDTHLEISSFWLLHSGPAATVCPKKDNLHPRIYVITEIFFICFMMIFFNVSCYF